MKWEYLLIDFGVSNLQLNSYGAMGWELIQMHDRKGYFKRPLPEPEAKPVKGKLMTANLLGYPPEIVHGVNCPKVWHDPTTPGHLHDEDDDGPYDVDGVPYCGRCHRHIERFG